MTTSQRCRRKTHRFELPPHIRGALRFTLPEKGGEPLRAPLRDISAVGVSFMLPYDLGTLEIGQHLRDVAVELDSHKVQGDLVVMHVTPEFGAGQVCGALLYPRGERDVTALSRLLEALESRDDL